MSNMTTLPHHDLATSLQDFGLERDRMRAALARRAGISQTDLDALEHLEAAGPLTQRQLGDRLALTSGAVTMLADRLERAGLVRRRPHPADRRFVLLELSQGAIDRAPAGLASYHAAISALIASLADDQREIIGAFLCAAATAAAGATDQLAAGAAEMPGEMATES